VALAGSAPPAGGVPAESLEPAGRVAADAGEPADGVPAEPPPGELRRLYRLMLLIRRVEERLAADSAAGLLPGGVHLYIGEEAVASGICAHLGDDDRITSTHRGHGHFLAKGGDPKAMLAEIWGKATGICRGMGGSMHVADLSKGILGANGIVGGGLAIAAGAAFAAQLDGKGRVVAAFFGDGAANQGVLMETLNVAALWQLPLVFVCEHNQFSEFTPSAQVTAGEIPARATAFGIPAVTVDGNDVVAVWRAGGEAVRRARNGGGPSFVEARTYRVHGHLEAEALLLGGGRYRDDAEIDAWRRRDPVEALAARLVSSGRARPEELGEDAALVLATVREAAEFAHASPPADPGLARRLMPAGLRP